MKLVVTGALGHIGSRLIHGFRPGDFEEVVLIDDLSTQRYCSLFNLPEGVKFRFFEEDVCTANLEERFGGAGAVIHLAAATDAATSFQRKDEVERVNGLGTERVARACAASGAGLVFVSTTSVYGSQDEVVDEQCEERDLKPQSPYAESKLKGEETLRSLGREGGLRFVVLRFGTIFGISIGMRFHTAINKFLWQACLGQPITVWRTARHQKRPYLDLGDAVRSIGHVVRTGRFDRETYNVVTANATVGEIIEILGRFVPGIEVHTVDSPIMNQLSYSVKSEKFQALGFRFEGSLEEGIRDGVRLFRGVRDGLGGEAG